MISIAILWEVMRTKEYPIRYAAANGNYYLYMNNLDNSIEWSCILPTEEASEFESSHKAQAIEIGG